MLKSIASSLAVCMAILTVSCSSQSKAPVYANIAYDGAAVLSSPSAEGAQTDELKYGEIVELIGEPDGAYRRVRNIATGVEGYVDTMTIDIAQYPLEAPEISAEEQSEPYLLNIEYFDNGEETDGWAFWADGDGVMAFNSVRTVYNDGRCMTFDRFYKGEIHPGYLLLTEELSYGETSGEKLETPIVIYEDIASRMGVFEGGKCFTPGGELCGIDDDEDWD